MTKYEKDRAKFAVVSALTEYAKTLDTQNNEPEMNTEIMNVILLTVKRLGVFKNPTTTNDEYEELANSIQSSVVTVS